MKFKNFPERIRALGEVLGYPKCCIESMAQHYEDNPNSKGYAVYMEATYGKSKLSGTGFVPCPSCYHKDAEEMIVNINKNRHNELSPFPYSKFEKLCEIIDRKL